MDISKIKGLFDETIVVYLPRDKQPNHEIHERSNMWELQVCQSLEPSSEQVCDSAGEKPEREQIDISPT